jgi:hypothetical protein
MLTPVSLVQASSFWHRASAKAEQAASTAGSTGPPPVPVVVPLPPVPVVVLPPLPVVLLAPPLPVVLLAPPLPVVLVVLPVEPPLPVLEDPPQASKPRHTPSDTGINE